MAPVFDNPADLAPLRGRKRVVLVFAPSPADPRARAARREFDRLAGRPDDRDLAFALVTRDGPLRRRYSVAAAAFREVLVGKDGHVAVQAEAPLAAEVLAARIDSMPMRREEMRRPR